MRDWLDEEIVTRAPFSREASAVVKPMPDVPPMIRMCLPARRAVYFCASDMAESVGLNGEMICEMDLFKRNLII